jgi:hypothetical protein
MISVHDSSRVIDVLYLDFTKAFDLQRMYIANRQLLLESSLFPFMKENSRVT